MLLALDNNTKVEEDERIKKQHIDDGEKKVVQVDNKLSTSNWISYFCTFPFFKAVEECNFTIYEQWKALLS